MNNDSSLKGCAMPKLWSRWELQQGRPLATPLIILCVHYFSVDITIVKAKFLTQPHPVANVIFPKGKPCSSLLLKTLLWHLPALKIENKLLEWAYRVRARHPLFSSLMSQLLHLILLLSAAVTEFISCTLCLSVPSTCSSSHKMLLSISFRGPWFLLADFYSWPRS